MSKRFLPHDERDELDELDELESPGSSDSFPPQSGAKGYDFDEDQEEEGEFCGLSFPVCGEPSL